MIRYATILRVTTVFYIAMLGWNTADANKPEYSIESQLDHGIGLTSEPKPKFPSSLLIRGIYSGYLTLSVNVDANGNLVDWLVIESSHRDLANSIEEVIRQWSFQPAMINGSAVSSVQNFPFYFSCDEDLIEEYSRYRLLSETDFNNKILYIRKNAHVATSRDFKISTRSSRQSSARNRIDFQPIKNLDRQPEAIQRVCPDLSQEQIESNLGSEVLVRFYIDTEGKARLPAFYKIYGNPTPDVLLSIQIAIRQWRFTVPTSKGVPVISEAIQPFRISYINSDQ